MTKRLGFPAAGAAVVEVKIRVLVKGKVMSERSNIACEDGMINGN